MPDHIGRITLKGEEAKKLVKLFGKTIKATITAEVKSLEKRRDFEIDSKKEPQEVLHVELDIKDVTAIRSGTAPLKDVLEDK